MKILGIIVAIISFLLLVVSHEFGHMMVGKLCGVRVDEFSVGMGPLIFKKQGKETQYSLRAIPFGGYCKFNEDEESDDPRAFVNAAWYKRALILFAGAFMNLLVCIIILISVYTYIGSYSPYINTVQPGSPADKAGIIPTDRILAVNDVYYDDWADIVNAISSSEGDVKITFKHSYSNDSNAKEEAYLTPMLEESTGRRIIGVTCRVDHSIKQASKESLITCKEYVVETGKALGRLVTGKAQDDEIVGVVGIVSIVSDELQYGIVNVIYLMGIISLNLAVINLLPFPALDGGRLLFILLELITRNKINKNVEAAVNTAGLMILLALAVYLIFRDTFNIFVK